MPVTRDPEYGQMRSSTAGGHDDRREGSWNQRAGGFGSIVAGGALAVYGATRRSPGGTALAAAGGLLALRGIRRNAVPKPVQVERSFTINRPVEEVYSYFRNFENFPKFMHHLQQVRNTGERRSHWIARAPMGLELEWDVEIVDEEQNRYLVWSTVPGAPIPARGSAEFQPASQYHGGTLLTVTLEYAPPAGRGAALFARIFRHDGRGPKLRIGEELRHLKQLLETGEIATTEGQSHGRRSPFVRMVQAVHEPPREWRRGGHDRWADVG